MNIGKMRDRIQFQQQQATGRSPEGEPVTDWVNVGEPVWAEAIPLRGQKFFAAQQMQVSVDTTFRIRYRADVREISWRLLWDGQPYDIQALVPIENKSGLEIMAVKGVRNGR